MKIASPQIIHKSDAGGVKVGLKTSQEVKRAFKEIIKNAKKYDRKAIIKGVLVQEMVKAGKENIIGSKLEKGFGPVDMIGMGGIYVEVLKDVTFRLAPVTDSEADEMISSIKTNKLLQGVRGEKPSDTKKLSECIQRISDRKSTRLNSSHLVISYAVFCLKKKKRDRDRVHPGQDDTGDP